MVPKLIGTILPVLEGVTINDKELVIKATLEVLVVVITTVVKPSGGKDTSDECRWLNCIL